ncbi:MAG: molybdenum cofactor guanylyltransferase [candidate division Zixibacteria bacterium]|nr:molybdenum cofactor guanylyltransferase [candidate division Zixibacteria bacterium]
MPSSIPKRDIAGLILIGGRSQRMGRDKATLEIAGIPLWQRAIDILEPLVGMVFLVGSVPGFRPPAPFAHIADDPPGLGPLGGIASGLERSGCQHHIVLAVDYPLVQSKLLLLLLEKSAGVRAVCGQGELYLEPLVGYYHALCAPVMRAMLSEGEIRTHRVFDRVPSHILTAEEYDAADPRRLSQINVNTPADCDRVHALLETRPTP